MSEKLSYAQVRDFLLNLANLIIQEKNDLNNMDAACGDGDFGTSMFIAFTNVYKTVEETQHNDIGHLLSSAGASILSSTGGAAGPLFGTLFLEAGKRSRGRTEIGIIDLEEMFDSSIQKMKSRGGAAVGDKTLIDALEPAVTSLKQSASIEASMKAALDRAAEAAKSGSDSTKRLVAKHGKARYLHEQTLGHVDPGAHVIALIFTTLATCYAHT